MSSAVGSSAAGLFSRNKDPNGPMRGLVSFIADLRNARARELEEKRINKELANIRQRFKEPGLNGYQRKKYVCKLLYIYILGWDVDFGHVEAVRLVSASTYSEKQIGYLAVTLFLHEKHELLPLVVNTFRKDLMDTNELNNCLALHAIANVGSREMADSLSLDVYRLMVSPVSRSFVKKKAALTLLRLYRKHPAVLLPDWSAKIVALMDDPDLGVALSVASLVTALVQQEPDLYKDSYVKAVRRLKAIVIDRECAADYYYYKVPCPWYQIKLMRLLQYYPPSEDTLIRGLLRDTLMRVFEIIPSKNVQQNNAQNAVLFEAIALAIHLENEPELMAQISARLGRFIQSRETNVRYLGMAAMTHLAARSQDLSAIRQHQPVIMGALRDRDVSVRRQGLDLLYSICDSVTAPAVVAELLSHLAGSELGLRDEMVLKVAILAEKYAVEARWYVDTALRLLATAGDSVNGDVWQRVVQVVTNNEALQQYAARTVLQYVRQPRCPDGVVKIGAYLLGEFGHLVADQQSCSPVEQFVALQSKIGACSPATRAMILSCFIKFVNLFPEIKPQLVTLFRLFSRNLDAELQQRACEYLALAELPSDETLRAVCDEMPPFPARASALLARLHQRHVVAAGDRQTWVVGGRDANEDNAELKVVTAQKTGAVGVAEGGSSKGLADLEGLDLSSSVSQPPFSSPDAVFPLGWEEGYRRLFFEPEGVLFENSIIRILMDRVCCGEDCVVTFTFCNRQSEFPIRSLTSSIEVPSSGGGSSALTPVATSSGAKTENGVESGNTGPLSRDLRSLPDSTIPPRGRTTQEVVFHACAVFRSAALPSSTAPTRASPSPPSSQSSTTVPSANPTLKLSFLTGTVQSLAFRIPLGIHHFTTAVTLSADDFFRRWKQIGDGAREAQKIFGLVGNEEKTSGGAGDGNSFVAESQRNGFSRVINPDFTASVIESFGWGLLPDVDPNKRNFVGAAVVHTVRDGKFGCLLRLEPNYETMMYRLTIRATGEGVSAVLLDAMVEQLQEGEGA